MPVGSKSHNLQTVLIIELISSACFSFFNACKQFFVCLVLTSRFYLCLFCFFIIMAAFSWSRLSQSFPSLHVLEVLQRTSLIFLYLEHYLCPFSFREPSKSHIDTLALDAAAQRNSSFPSDWHLSHSASFWIWSKWRWHNPGSFWSAENFTDCESYLISFETGNSLMW